VSALFSAWGIPSRNGESFPIVSGAWAMPLTILKLPNQGATKWD